MNQWLKKEIYVARRFALLEQIREKYGLHSFLVILIANFEEHRHVFRQESSFLYLSGIEEPGSVFCMDDGGHVTLYIPQYKHSRSLWVSGSLTEAEKGSAEAQRMGVDEVVYAGEPWQTFSASMLGDKKHYKEVIASIEKAYAKEKAICTVGIGENGDLEVQKVVWSALKEAAGVEEVIDISAELDRMRKTKEVEEISYIHEAVRVTAAAHEAAAKMIAPGATEYELHSCIESVFLYLGASGPAFPSIIATGKNTTTLHYTGKRSTLRDGDLVLLDIGAEYGYYAADISRTYPASGLFTDRQAEIYTLVLQAQRYVEDHVKPGMFLYNAQEPEKSLHHLTYKFFEYHGCAQHFPHRVGHFLGLDVHDVGDTTEPLQEGDVITIEPGLYLQSEGIGVRIEDDYVVVQDGFVCLSEDIPKEIEEIEDLMNSAEREACDHV